MNEQTFSMILRRSLPAVYILAAFLTLVVIYTGYTTSKKIQETITQQFNQQQLILARKISDQIQNQISHLQISLLELKNISRLEGAEIGTLADKVFLPFKRLLAGDVLAILYLNQEGKIISRIQDPTWNPSKIPLPEPEALAPYLPAPLLRNRVWMGSTFLLDGRWVLPQGVPMSRKTKGREAAQGALFFILDAVHIAQKATGGVVSGRTGYAWIINREGILLDHHEKDFIDKSIFVVRKTRNPKLSYQKIDDLTRNELLQGKEGTSSYLSGWHRAQKTAVEKLIAYTPIPFYETPERAGRPQPIRASEIWSVALVAPVAEISGLVRSLNLQQFILIGIFQILIIVGTGVFVFISSRWTRYLSLEVEQKTEELKKTHERLVHSERLAAVGSMAGHVSHEIKNPLIAVGGLAQQLKRSPHLDEKEREKLELITTEVSRLEKMLIEVRDFTRPTTPNKVKTDINQVFRELIQLSGPVLLEHGIHTQTSLDDSLPPFWFDPGQMKQVFVNLIKNAAEAMPEGGTLSIMTRKERQGVMIQIADTGTGIDAKFKENLFRPFMTTKKKGTGLGLAVSYKLIQDHDGDITFESEADYGTTVIIRLPLEEENPHIENRNPKQI
jgi:two-component system, NtrC family, sensor histidine kinase HydH